MLVNCLNFVVVELRSGRGGQPSDLTRKKKCLIKYTGFYCTMDSGKFVFVEHGNEDHFYFWLFSIFHLYSKRRFGRGSNVPIPASTTIVSRLKISCEYGVRAFIRFSRKRCNSRNSTRKTIARAHSAIM